MSTAQQEEDWPSPASNNTGLKLFPGNAITLQPSSLSAHQEAARVGGNENTYRPRLLSVKKTTNLTCALKTDSNGIEN